MVSNQLFITSPITPMTILINLSYWNVSQKTLVKSVTKVCQLWHQKDGPLNGLYGLPKREVFRNKFFTSISQTYNWRP